MVGSTEFPLIWKEKATPAGRSISRLAPSMRRTSDSGSIGWASPNAQDRQSHNPTRWLERRAEHAAKGVNLQEPLSRQAQMFTMTWATPKASDGEGSRMTKTEGGGNAHLPIQARESAAWHTPLARDGDKLDATLPAIFKRMEDGREIGLAMQARLTNAPWSTPRASDGEKGGPNVAFGAGGQPLPAQAASASWPTPQAGTPAQNGNNEAGSTDFSRKIDVIEGLRETTNGARSGMTQNSASAQTEKRGALSPEFVFWLMGFPAEWVSCALAAMQSFRRSRPKSSAR